jgi:hypothetical protein
MANEFSGAWRERKGCKLREFLGQIEQFNREFAEDGEHLEKLREARKIEGSRSPYTLYSDVNPVMLKTCLPAFRRRHEQLLHRGDREFCPHPYHF